jgi:hypothetical protein
MHAAVAMTFNGSDQFGKFLARLPLRSSFSWVVAASDFLGGSRGPAMRSRNQVMVEVKIVGGVFLAAILGVIVLWLVSK